MILFYSPLSTHRWPSLGFKEKENRPDNNKIFWEENNIFGNATNFHTLATGLSFHERMNCYGSAAW